MLVEHLLSVGYTRVDVVEMPGQLTLRGGILDVYSPEMDRPVRIDFFGDEIESIRKFDPETQRSQSSLDTALLLPLTEIPITEKVLEAINARLTRSGTAAATEIRRRVPHISILRPGMDQQRSHRRSHHLPRLGVLRPRSRRLKSTLLDLLGPSTRVFIEEPAMIKNQGERWWNKVEQRHDRSGIGNLIRPEDIYTQPLGARRPPPASFPGCDLDQLGAVDILDADRSGLSEIDFHTRPTMRFHGSSPRPHRRRQLAHQAGSPRPPHRAQPGRSRTPRRPAAGI